LPRGIALRRAGIVTHQPVFSDKTPLLSRKSAGKISQNIANSVVKGSLETNW
jgi:hypothetical protein